MIDDWSVECLPRSISTYAHNTIPSSILSTKALALLANVHFEPGDKKENE
jgi:hypothetical protein